MQYKCRNRELQRKTRQLFSHLCIFFTFLFKTYSAHKMTHFVFSPYFFALQFSIFSEHVSSFRNLNSMN